MRNAVLNKIYSWGVSKLATRVLYFTYRKFPPVVKIETTNACNSSCIMCPHSIMKRDIGIMDDYLYEKIVKECANNNVKTLHLHNFGEPLLDKHFADRIAFAKKLGIPKIKFFTNASLLNCDKAEEIIRSGADEIKISIDGDSKETYNSIRVCLNYEIVSKNIINLIDLRKKSGAKKPTVKLNFVVRKDNFHEKSSFKKKWSRIVDSISFDKEHNWSGKNHFKQENEILHACLRPWNSFTILWDGRVALCCLDYDGETILGDINQQSIKEIWQSDKLRKIRSYHISQDFSCLPLCRSCSKIR